MPEADDGTVSTNVLLQIAQILVLRLPLGALQIIGSKWMKKFLIAEDKKKVEEFLPLFILSLKQQTLVEPFIYAPVSCSSEKWEDFAGGKQEFTQSDIKKSLKEDRNWNRDAPPYKIDISRDLMEYAAYQEIPNFGAHFYYAFSLEPLPNWQNFNKFGVPRKLIPSLTVDYSDAGRHLSSVDEPTTSEALEASIEAAQAATGSVTTSHVSFDPLIVQNVEGIPPVLERLLETSIDESTQNELDRTAQELERSQRTKGIPERLHKYMKDLPSPSSPAVKSSPALISSPALLSSSVLLSSPASTSTPATKKTPATKGIPAIKGTPATRRTPGTRRTPLFKTPAIKITPATIITPLTKKTLPIKKTPVTKKIPVTKKSPAITIVDEPSSVAETEETEDDVDDFQDRIIEDRVNETMRKIALASQSPMCKTRAQELKMKLHAIKTRKEEALIIPDVEIEPIPIEPIDIYQLPAEFLDASEKIRTVSEIVATEMKRLNINQTPDLVMSDFIVTATDDVGHQFLDAFHSTDDQHDFKRLAITAVEILDLTIDNRNRIQMAASPFIVVDSEVTQQLEEIRENIVVTEQRIEAADEIMDESEISEAEISANESQILEQIDEAIAVCNEEQLLLETSIREDESLEKFITLLSNNNDAAIKELVHAKDVALIDFESDLPFVTNSDQIDIKITAMTALEILDETIDNRNRIQMLAGPSIIVHAEVTQQLEEIRENIAVTEQRIEAADEIMDKSEISEAEISANKSQLLEQINEAIAVCKEEQVSLETSIPEDESSVKFVSLLSNSNNSTIEELEDAINQTPDSITDDFLVNDQVYQQIDYHEKILQVLSKAIIDRNRIQKKAGTSIIVDPEKTRQLQEIRENIATSDQLLPTQLTESEIKYFKILQKILKIVQKIIDICSNADNKLEKQMKGKTSKEYSDYTFLSDQFIEKMKKLLFEMNDSNPKDQNYPTLIGDLIEKASEDMEAYTDSFDESEKKNKFIQDNQDKKLDYIFNNLRVLNQHIESFQDESPIFLAELEKSRNNKILEAVSKTMILVKEENEYLESINQDRSNKYASMLSGSNNDTIEELEYIQDVLSDHKNEYEYEME